MKLDRHYSSPFYFRFEEAQIQASTNDCSVVCEEREWRPVCAWPIKGHATPLEPQAMTSSRLCNPVIILMTEDIGVSMDDTLALCPIITGVRGVQWRQNRRKTVISLLLSPSHQRPLNVLLCYKENKFDVLLRNPFNSPMCLYANICVPLCQPWVWYKHLPVSIHHHSNHRCYIKKWQHNFFYEITIPAISHGERAIAHAHCEQTLKWHYWKECQGLQIIYANPRCPQYFR